MDGRSDERGTPAMNFRDMTKEELYYYNKIRKRNDEVNHLIKCLAIFTVAFTATTIVVLFT